MKAKPVPETNTRAEMISWIKTLVFAVICSLFITNFVIVNASVPTGSMENLIMPGDRIIAFRLSYTMSPPKRYDIVVFRYPDDPSQLFIKRIIGLPGETVTISGGKVYIDGSSEPLDDTYIKETQQTEPEASFVVPEGHYFMMGDNRNVSHDSRRWKNTYVDEKDILGEALFRYFPSIKLLR